MVTKCVLFMLALLSLAMPVSAQPVREVFNYPALELNANIVGSAEWSPDGSQLTYVCGTNETLCISDSDGSNEYQAIPDTYQNVIYPIWSPDGTRIMFAAGVARAEVPFRTDLYELNVVSTEVRRITRELESNDYSGSYSPDGSMYVFSRQLEDQALNDLYIVNLETLEVSQMTATDWADEQDPAWSPDGKNIAMSASYDTAEFCRDGECRELRQYDIYVWDLDSSAVHRMTTHAEWQGNARWIDANTLVYEGGGMRAQNVYWVSLVDWVNTPITNCKPNECGVINPRWVSGSLIVQSFGGIGQDAAFIQGWQITLS